MQRKKLGKNILKILVTFTGWSYIIEIAYYLNRHFKPIYVLGLLSLGMHPLETVQAGQEGRSKADQGPYQLPSCRVMQVRQVPGMARQWGRLSRSHPGGNYCVFSSSPAHNTFLCLLGDWASVDGVTSFLCTLLINMCVSECMAVVRDIVFWS